MLGKANNVVKMFMKFQTLLLLVAVGVFGCEPKTKNPAAEQNNKPVVVATTTMLADMVRQIGGDGVDVVSNNNKFGLLIFN